jgi:protein-disulfide isomerase
LGNKKKKVRFLVDSFSILIVAAAIAVVGGRLLYNWTRSEPVPDAGLSQLAEFGRLIESGHLVGPENAPVVVVVFSSYGCSFCKQLQESFNVLMRRYSQHLAVVWKSFVDPARLTTYRVPLGVECARDQGRFSEYHRAAFENARVLTYNDGWRTIADSAGIPDRSGFEACVRSFKHLEKITEELREAELLDVTVSPTLFINAKKVVGAPSVEALDSLISQEFRGRAQLVRDGGP